ncbi:MAG: hypothetical protein V7K98_17305 [Nostoc sp.]
MAIQNRFGYLKRFSSSGLCGLLADFDAKNAYYVFIFSNFTKKS